MPLVGPGSRRIGGAGDRGPCWLCPVPCSSRWPSTYAGLTPTMTMRGRRPGRRLTTAQGLAVLGLGLSISVDELAIGFGVGLGSHGSALPVHQVATLITVILIQILVWSPNWPCP